MEQYIPHIAIMVVCLILSAYFSATETAFSTMSKTRIKTLAEKGNRRAALAVRLSDKYDKLLSTILIGNNIVNIALASLGTLVFVGLLTEQGQEVASTISTAVITVVVLLVGEITPKTAAKNRPEKFAMFAAPLIQFLMWLLMPISFLFNLWQKLVNKIFHKEDDAKTSQEELLMIVDEVEQEGSIDNDEGDLLRNAIEFTERKAEDILTHRVDLEGVPCDATNEEVAAMFSETRFSRLPVYEESIDKIVGIVHQKDFYTKDGITDKPLSELMTPPVFIHKTEKINDLLKELQTNKAHIAVVLDEYGGVLGIVTLTDLVECLVGEFTETEEGESEEELIVNLDECTWQIGGTAALSDVEQELGIKIGDEDSDTFGGYVLGLYGSVPDDGSTFKLSTDILDISIEAIKEHKIERAIVTLRSDEPDENTEKDKEE